MSREQQHWPALRETQPQVLFMSCQWPLPRTWKLCASYVTCSAYLGDKVCWTIMWLGILTFPLSLKISMPDIKHIPFYFNIVYLPKSGYDLKLDPAMSIPWYFVFLYYDERSLTLQLLPCWDFCNVLACEKVLFFFFLALWLSEWISFCDYKYMLSKSWFQCRIALFWLKEN